MAVIGGTSVAVLFPSQEGWTSGGVMREEVG